MPIKQNADGSGEVSVCVNRQRLHRRIPKGTSARDAKQLEAELRTALGKHRTAPQAEPRLNELMAAYMRHAETLRGPRPATYHALRIGRWVESYTASQARQCAAAIIQDLAGHYKPGTINKSLGTLKKACSMAYDRGLTPVNYGDQVKLLPENNIRTTSLTLAEVQRLADCASENVRAAIWIAVYTGCRRGEICGIKAEDIGPDAIILRSGSTKTQKHRAIPIIAPLRPWMAYLPLPIGVYGLEKGFWAARARAGMPHITFHDLRRSCAVLMLQAGAPMHVISKLLGHSSTRVTESRYAHVQLDAVRAGLNAAFTPAVTPAAASA